MDAEASMIHATCFFTNPKASEFSRFLVDYIWGIAVFIFWWLGDVFFFGKKWGVLVTFPWGVRTVLMEEIMHQVIHL